jgi:hypothetical protein
MPAGFDGDRGLMRRIAVNSAQKMIQAANSYA